MILTVTITTMGLVTKGSVSATTIMQVAIQPPEEIIAWTGHSSLNGGDDNVLGLKSKFCRILFERKFAQSFYHFLRLHLMFNI